MSTAGRIWWFWERVRSSESSAFPRIESERSSLTLRLYCFSMAEWSDALFRLWLARPDDRKFDLICIVHNSNDAGWAETYSADWVRVRFFP